MLMIYKFYLLKLIDYQVLQKNIGKAVPLYAYLDSESEENIERHTKFLSMVSNMNISQIHEIEEEQKILNEHIPFKIKYPKDYLWQIYYSEYTNQYFMLVTIEDLEYSAFFYLLKKQLQKNKNEKIFVPISYTDYSREYLGRAQITDLENYLWLFTKEWPIIYEVYDENNNLSLNIVGETYIFDDIQSDYNIKLNNKEDAIKFYKLLKALFIIQTEISHHYKFDLSIDEKGSLQFNIDNKKIIYEILPSFIKEEYLKAEDNKLNLVDEKIELEKELDELQRKSSKLEKEYLEKEKQISTFLECKKSFIGIVKYFFKYKKVNLIKQEGEPEKKQEVKVIRLNKYGEVKSNYTLEELIEIYRQIDKEEIRVKNLKLDIKAINQRINNLENKVKNAILYIQEIDEHKKSIFEFWKFTNKDKQEELPEGKIEDKNRDTLKKIFDYKLDFEDLAASLDKTQRELLTKKELDSIYLTTTEILEDINNIYRGKKITNERLEQLKKKAIEENSLIEKENFNIFGGISYDNKIKMLANKKHREVEREVFRILDINKNTTIEDYTGYIKQVVKDLKVVFGKIKLPLNLSVYKADTNMLNKDNYNIFNITGSKEIGELLKKDINSFYIYKINLKENTPIIPFTNIVYYENSNQTLPLGMNVSENILLNNNLINIEPKLKKKIKIVCYSNPEDELSDITVKTINVEEYEVKSN